MVRVLAHKLYDKMRISKRISHQPKLSSLSYTVDFRLDTLNASITVIHIIFWFDLVFSHNGFIISLIFFFFIPFHHHCAINTIIVIVILSNCLFLYMFAWFDFSFTVLVFVCIAWCFLWSCNYLPYHNKIKFNLKCSNLCELENKKEHTYIHTYLHKHPALRKYHEKYIHYNIYLYLYRCMRTVQMHPVPNRGRKI